MQSIYICEDNKSQLNDIKRLIENYIMIEELDMEVALATQNPDSLIESLKDNRQRWPSIFWI